MNSPQNQKVIPINEIAQSSYTKIPNNYFELMKNLSFIETYVLIFILRYTLGYNKNECVFNVTKFAEQTNTRRPTISNAIKSLKEKKIIAVEKTGKNLMIRLLTLAPN